MCLGSVLVFRESEQRRAQLGGGGGGLLSSSLCGRLRPMTLTLLFFLGTMRIMQMPFWEWGPFYVSFSFLFSVFLLSPFF